MTNSPTGIADTIVMYARRVAMAKMRHGLEFYYSGLRMVALIELTISSPCEQQTVCLIVKDSHTEGGNPYNEHYALTVFSYPHSLDLAEWSPKTILLTEYFDPTDEGFEKALDAMQSEITNRLSNGYVEVVGRMPPLAKSSIPEDRLQREAYIHFTTNKEGLEPIIYMYARDAYRSEKHKPAYEFCLFYYPMMKNGKRSDKAKKLLADYFNPTEEGFSAAIAMMREQSRLLSAKGYVENDSEYFAWVNSGRYYPE